MTEYTDAPQEVDEALDRATVASGDTVPRPTFGQRAVGQSFNPSQDSDVDKVKTGFAEMIDYLHDKRSESGDPEVKRMYSLAITDLQTAQMWSVKALTWNL